jgi:hypothetical protein
MKLTARCSVAFSAVTFFFSCASGTFAQAPLEPAQMPARTTFYLMWRGAPDPALRKANSLLALWDDPDFAPVRSAMAEGLLSNSEKKSTQQQLTRQEFDEYALLLENPFVIGYLNAAERPGTVAPSASRAAVPAWNGMFLVYDRTGKEATLAKAVLRMRGQEQDPPKMSQVVIAGVPALKIERKTTVTYWAEHGKYAISANERSVFEEIVGRLNGLSGVAGKPAAAATSLAQSAAYREAQPLLGTGLLEFFVRVPSLEELSSSVGPAGTRLGPLLQAAKLDAVHSFCGHLTLEGAKTRVQAAILGKAAPGTLFDIWPTEQTTLASLAVAPADAVAYNATQLNFLGVYQLVKRMIGTALPSGRPGGADMLDTLAQARLGDTLPNILQSLTGELASMQSSPSLDSERQIYFVGVRKKPEVLKVIRTVFGDRMTSERNEGDTTFLKLSLGSSQGSAGVAQWNFYYLGITPSALLGAPRMETIRDLLAGNSQHPTATLGALPKFQRERAQFPEHVMGISYFDFQKLDWQALKNHWIEELQKKPDTKAANGASQSSGSKVPEWLTRADLRVVPRHLHISSSASWKDAQGVHFDQWLE